jgi:hypothetical protein
MSTDAATSARAPRSRFAHALLALLLLLTTTASAMHPFALDEHRASEICGACLAHAHGGEAPLPAFVLPHEPSALAPAQAHPRSLVSASTLLHHRARAPPV